MNHFRAPWRKSLIVASIFATLVCLGASYALWKLPMEVSESIRFWLALLPLAIILLCALFVVRGYSITNDALLIDRLFWETRVPLSGLQSVKFDPDATGRSIRTFGNGGFFSFTGYFRNNELSTYRASSDRSPPRRGSALPGPCPSVSPDRPEEFVSAISRYAGRG